MYSILKMKRSGIFLAMLIFSVNIVKAGSIDTIEDINNNFSETIEKSEIFTLSQELVIANNTNINTNINTNGSSSKLTKNESVRMFESMAMQFLLANREKIQPEVAAAMYGYAVKDLNKKGQECHEIGKINNSIDARTALATLHAEMLTYLNTNSKKYADHEYTISIDLDGTMFHDYDQERSALIIDQWNRIGYSVSAQGERDQRKFYPCRAMLSLPEKAQIPVLKNKIPIWFKFKFVDDVRRLQPEHDKRYKRYTSDFVSAVLGTVPMSSEKALTLLRRDRLDKKLRVSISFEFKPAQPFYALDDVSARNSIKPLPRQNSGNTREWSHETILKSITYTDKKTGEIIYRLGINNDAITCESLYRIGGGLVKCPSLVNFKIEIPPAGQDDHLSKVNLSENISTKEQATSRLSKKAKEYRSYCITRRYDQIYFDCDCLAQTFDQKLAAGEEYPQKSLRSTPQPACARPEKIADFQYKNCIKRRKALKQFGHLEQQSPKEMERVCSCTGDTTAKRFYEYPVLSEMRNISGKAAAACEQPYK